MTQNYVHGQNLFFGVFIISILFLGSYGQVGKSQGAWPQAAHEESYREAQIVEAAYSLILDRYVIPVDSDGLISSALQGMQGFVGQDMVSFTREPNGFIVSSHGQSIKVENVSEKGKGAKEMARIYSFVARTNPQYDRQALAYAAIKKMVRMDEHSDLVLAKDYTEAQKVTQGKAVVEVGLDLEKKNGRIQVLGRVDQSPAFRAGIVPGDEVTMINGKLATDLTVQEAYALLRGQNETEITLTIRREAFSEPMTFKMTPQVVVRRNLQHELVAGHYAYIHISQFGEKTVADFDRAIREAEEASAKGIKGIVLDLRNSPGGLLVQALRITDIFVKSGLLISLEGRQGMGAKYFARSENKKFSLPVVVLVNGFTYAGSEIVAGVLQDHERALIVGTTTGGNGSTETIFPLSDGSALRLTTHLWKLPRGRAIEKAGVVPDFDIGTKDSALDVKKEGGRDTALGVAIQILNTAASGSMEDLRRAAREVAGTRDPQGGRGAGH